MVKIKDEDPDDITTQITKKFKSHAKNSDLPFGAHDGNQFHGKFVPTMTWNQAFQDDTFKIDDNDQLTTLHEGWKVIYGNSVP
jgi:hypothetical protein